MIPELQTRIAIAEKYGEHPDPKVRCLASILRLQIRTFGDSEALRETIQLTFQRLRSRAGE